LSNPLLKKSFLAGVVPITPNSFVKFTASETVGLCTASTDAAIGITDAYCDPVLGDRLDVTQIGIYEVVAGGAIVRGALVMSDANGHAIPWTTGNWVAGQAQESAAAGDLIPVKVF
jgi:hypothetical protein